MTQLPLEVLEEMFPDGVCQTCAAVVTKQVVGAGEGFRVGAIVVEHEPACPNLDKLSRKGTH
ncbi:MAG: hypothetical protein M3094_08215 [Actinomycetia bacterium]|nr:hypothetical protein [Actinomycetes bacterium]